MPTPLYDRRIDHPMAWRGSDFGSKEKIAYDLSARQVAALEDVLARVNREGLTMREIRPEHCRHPALDADLEKIFDEIQEGRGIVVVRGFPVQRHSVEDVSRMYWAFGTHFGIGVSQSALGDLLGSVRDETPPGQLESARGYLSRRELSLHNDLGQIVGLMCVRQARSGGYSQWASGLAVHNEILATRPDLMPILYRGFPYHRRGEQPAHQPDITPYDMPVFSNVEGHVSVFMVREIFGVALRDLGRTMAPEEVEAVDLFRDISRKVQLEARLEPGEAVFLNNYTVMHARSEFEDWDEPGQKRLMLRLWLDCERKVRPHVRELHVYENEGGRSGIDPVPGRLPAQPNYRMNEQKLPVGVAAE
jgi:hypothetical protein